MLYSRRRIRGSLHGGDPQPGQQVQRRGGATALRRVPAPQLLRALQGAQAAARTPLQVRGRSLATWPKPANTRIVSGREPQARTPPSGGKAAHMAERYPRKGPCRTPRSALPTSLNAVL